MASGPLDVDKRRGERTLKCRRRKRTNKYSVRQSCGQAAGLGGGDDEFAHFFSPGEEWNGVSGGKDDNLVDEEEEEMGMNPIGSGFTKPDSYLVVNMSDLKSKRAVRKLKRRLTEELEQVRDVVKQLKDQRTPTPSHSYSSMGGDDLMRSDDVACIDENPMQDYSDVAPFQDQDEFFAFVSSRGGDKSAKKSTKAAELGKESDAVVSKKNIPLSRNVGNPSARVSQSDCLLQAFKSCKSLLTQLMKHKFGWVFSEPVDADGLKLYDYHTIIKQPMDLGTVKERLTTNWYESPMEFAEDVRLTFRNAMTYNPIGHEVHLMAEQLSEIFEKKWIVIEEKYKCDSIDSDVDLAALGNNVDSAALGRDVDLVAPTLDRISHPSSPSMRSSGTLESSCSETPANSASPGQELVQQMPEIQINTPSMGMLDGLESSPGEIPINSASPFQEAIPEMPGIHRTTPSPRTVNALEINSCETPADCASLVQEFIPEMVEARNDMSYEEKQKLNASIQELPPMKLGGVVDIIKKKNSALFQNEDEVELDINFLDAETLWELENYVLECNGCSGATKRKPIDSYQTSTELDCALLEKGASEFRRTSQLKSNPVAISNDKVTMEVNQAILAIIYTQLLEVWTTLDASKSLVDKIVLLGSKEFANIGAGG